MRHRGESEVAAAWFGNFGEHDVNDIHVPNYVYDKTGTSLRGALWLNRSSLHTLFARRGSALFRRQTASGSRGRLRWKGEQLEE